MAKENKYTNITVWVWETTIKARRADMYRKQAADSLTLLNDMPAVCETKTEDEESQIKKPDLTSIIMKQRPRKIINHYSV